MRRARIPSGVVVGLILAVAASVVASPYSHMVLGDNPIRYYRLGEASGATAYDSSTTGANGTYKNLAPASYGQPGALVGGLDTCVLLDGTNDYIEAPDAPDLRITGDLTIEFWYHKTAEQTDWVRLVGKGSKTHRTYGVWEESTSGERLLFQQYDSGSNVFNLYSTSSIPVGQWAHVAAVVKGNTCQIYVDGKLDATATRSRPPSVDTQPLRIGYAGTGFHEPFLGYMDEVAIYDHAVDPADIAVHYNTGMGFSYSEIIANDGAGAYYRFEDASSADGDPAADSIDGHHGTYKGNVALASGLPHIGGQAASFDGASHIKLPDAPFGSYPTSGSTSAYVLSFETWFNTTGDGAILGQKGVVSGHVPAIYVDTDGKVRASMFYHGSSLRQIVSEEAYNGGEWHHLVDVYNNGTETLYIDGVKIGSQTYAQYAYSTGEYNYYLGTAYAAGWRQVGGASWFGFNGLLDETAIYPLALTEGQVRAHYRAGIPEPTTLALLGLGGLALAARRRRLR